MSDNLFSDWNGGADGQEEPETNKRKAFTTSGQTSRPKASAYAKRTASGRFKEMDNVGRSQKADKPRKAKKKVRSGYGDQGDERPRTRRRARR